MCGLSVFGLYFLLGFWGGGIILLGCEDWWICIGFIVIGKGLGILEVVGVEFGGWVCLVELWYEF